MSSAWRHILVTVMVAATVVGMRLAVSGTDELEDLAWFEESTGISVGPDTAFFANGLAGDGATFVIMALDPIGSDIGNLLYLPSYRYLRFGFSWIAQALVGGSEGLILLGLSAVGVVSLGFTAYLASRLNETRGSWAWLLVVNPALIMGVLSDTAEPLALALITLAIFAGSTWLACLVAIIRPSFLVAMAGRWRALAIGAGIAVLSKAYWSWHFEESYLPGVSILDWPLLGVVASPTILGWILTGSALITAIIGVARKDWAWIISGLLVLCFGQVVMGTSAINAFRAAGFLPVLWAFGPNYVSHETIREIFGMNSTVQSTDVVEGSHS